jgi:hypothetical protein
LNQTENLPEFHTTESSGIKSWFVELHGTNLLRFTFYSLQLDRKTCRSVVEVMEYDIPRLKIWTLIRQANAEMCGAACDLIQAGVSDCYDGLSVGTLNSNFDALPP